jgi:hypothetical protein
MQQHMSLQRQQSFWTLVSKQEAVSDAFECAGDVGAVITSHSA